VFGLAIVGYYALCGFLLVYLWTRLYLAGAFREAERDYQYRNVLAGTIATLDSVEAKLDESDQQQVRVLRYQAERQLGTLERDLGQVPEWLTYYAREYEQLRRTMPRGSERTFAMNTVVARIRAVAGQQGFVPEDVRNQWNKGSDGHRVVALALLSVSPYPECLDLILEGIKKSRSAFEQYHALRVAELVVPSLTSEQKPQLRDAIEDQQSGGESKYLIPENRDRYQLSNKILRALG
jgi:hypothetical protein